MGSALISSEKSPSLPERLRRKSHSTQSNTTTISKQEYYSTIHQVQVSETDSKDDDEEKTQWSFERRTATLRDTKKATEEFLAACTKLKKNVSTKVDALLNDLPDAHDPQFETKYKMFQRQLQKLLPKNQNKFKQQTKNKS